MSRVEAFEALKQGKRVKMDRPESHRFYQMFQGDVIISLLPVGACCAEVHSQWAPGDHQGWFYYAKFDQWVIYDNL